MTETVEKFIPIFVGLFLILRGLLWVADGKNGRFVFIRLTDNFHVVKERERKKGITGETQNGFMGKIWDERELKKET